MLSVLYKKRTELGIGDLLRVMTRDIRGGLEIFSYGIHLIPHKFNANLRKINLSKILYQENTRKIRLLAPRSPAF